MKTLREEILEKIAGTLFEFPQTKKQIEPRKKFVVDSCPMYHAMCRGELNEPQAILLELPAYSKINSKDDYIN